MSFYSSDNICCRNKEKRFVSITEPMRGKKVKQAKMLLLSERVICLAHTHGIDEHICNHVHDFTPTNWPLRDVQAILQGYFEIHFLIYILSTCCGISVKVVSWDPIDDS